MLALVLLILSLVISAISTRSTRAQLIYSVTKANEGLVSSLDAVDQANQELVLRSAKAFRQHFDAQVELAPDTGALLNAGQPVDNDFSLVDKFSQDTGAVATVFARQGEEFVRIATSLHDLQGQRVMHTRLERSHPASALVRAGKTYTGKATLFGRPYMTHYEPLHNSAGQIVALLFVGNDLSVFQQQMQRQVGQMRMFEHGGTVVIDATAGLEQAVFLAHPSAIGSRVLDSYPQARETLQALASSSTGTLAGVYPLLPAQGADPWAVLRTTQAGWWVMTEVSDDEALAGQRQAQWWIWGCMLGAMVLLAGGLLWMLTRGVGQPLRELTRAITLVASGDLTQAFRSQRQDEIGALVHEVEEMRQRYVAMLRQVHSAAHSISTASHQIAQGNGDLSERTEHTAGRLATTAQSMAELTDTVHHSAQSARQAHLLTNSAAGVAARGGEVVGQVVATMGEINGSSRRIADIIGVIDGIAFQTNILALNAAVEAARAGEQGRGFAVVASEVRTLAGRVGDAAKEISALIGASVEKVESGARLVQNAGATMQEIVQSVQQVGDIVGEISTAATEQAQRIANVNQAVAELDQMTQQNAALVEESAAASQSMREQATRLEGSVDVFKL